jgi:hypothetical protein
MPNNTPQSDTTIQEQSNNQKSEITTEIEAIKKLLQSNQPNLALARIEEAQLKFPNSVEILALKLRIFRASGNTQLAYDIAKSLLTNSPNHPIAISEYILSTANNGNLKEAIDTLINYCESSHDELNPYLVSAALELAYFLLLQGAIGTATAIAYCLRHNETFAETADTILYSANAASDIPLLIRAFGFDYNCPDNFSGKKEFEHATLLMSQLRWKEALKSLKSISQYTNEWATLQRNIAVLHYWLLEAESTCEILKGYAADPNVATEDAADVEALRISINPDFLGEPDYILHAGYKITDANAALEKLLSSNQTVPMPFDQREFVQQNQVPPKGVFKILSRPMPTSDVELTIDNIPSYFAIAMLFGKETDNDARIEIVELPKLELKNLENVLKQILGDLFVTNLSKTETMKSYPRTYNLVPSRFVFPQNNRLNAEQQQKLIEQYLMNNFALQWLKTTFESLGNKTPIDAAKEPAYKIRLLGLLTLLEHSILNVFDNVGTNVVNHLRKTLGYQLLDTIQIQGTTDDEQSEYISGFPIWRWYRFDIKQLSGKVLADCFQLVNALNDSRGAQLFAQELLDRPLASLPSNITQIRMFAYDRLIKIKRQNNEFEAALKLIDKAKNESVLTNSIDAVWYMHEIPIRLILNQLKHAETAISYIANRYKNNEKVMREFYSLMMQLGLVRSNGRAAGGESEIANEGKLPQQENTGIWTPDDNNQPQENKKTKLWTPD